jgi:hypothetical protein
LSDRVDEYEGMPRPKGWTDRDGWERFYNDRDRRLTRLESQYENWKALLDRTSDLFKDEMAGFDAATGAWIIDQEERTALSRSCFETSARFADQARAEACLSRVFFEHGDEWSRTRQALHDIIVELRSRGVLRSY